MCYLELHTSDTETAVIDKRSDKHQDLAKYSPIGLMQLRGAVISRLKKLGIVRTENKPLGDYAEDLVCKNLSITRMANNQKSFDAIDDKDGTRYQIKARRASNNTNSIQLSAIRSYDFDYLIAVVFDLDYQVRYAVKIASCDAKKLAKHSEHVNGDLLTLKESVLSRPEVENMTDTFDPCFDF
jgi:hypothetical protein